MTTLRLVAAASALALLTAACTSAPPLDLHRGGGDRLVEASAAGHDRAAVVEAGERGLRIDDVLVRGFAAGPPGRLRFAIDVPKDGRLHLTCAIDPRFHDRPGVEFTAKIRKNGRETAVWTQVVDPITHPEHRGFVTAEVDLAPHAGNDRELLLEAHGYEESGDVARAFWGAPTITSARQKAPLVVVYLVDTLRADHTGVYGYARPTTPELDRFAKDAVVFDAAVAHASWTKPSVASVLTSRLPGHHRAVQLRDPLDPATPTIAKRLNDRGWSTGAAIANSVVYGEESAFDPGFDVFAGLHGEDDQRSKLVGADVVVDSALAFLKSRRGLPTFLYVHTMDPHVPYAPPEPFDRMFEPHPVEGHPAQDPRTDYKEPLDRERMIAQYDGDIAFGDREFGRFVRQLKQDGLYDDALVVFLADHGEEFMDHGLWLHGRSLFDELIHVPLVVKFPGNEGKGRRIAEQVQLVDVLPTVLDLAKAPIPPEAEGRPLQVALRGGGKVRPALAEISHRGFVAHGVRTEGDKFIRRFSPADDELYFDLARDPKEQVNRAAENAQRVRLLQAQAESAMASNPFRYVVQVAGPGTYVLRIETHGWLEGIETTGFGPAERWTVGGNGRSVHMQVQPKAGTPREIGFTVRPVGAPVQVLGTRDGRPLSRGDLLVGGTSFAAEAFPFRLPDIESETDRDRGLDLFRPPAAPKGGVRVWLTLPPGRTIGEMDPATRERLKALGYVGPG